MQYFDNITAIGLMSDPSLEGIEAAIIKSNGLDCLEIGESISRPYDEYLIEQIKDIRGEGYHDFPKKLKKAEYDFTMANVSIIKDLLEYAKINPSEIGVIGFHGLTLYHNPKEKKTFQLGDAALLAEETKINVVAKFRSNDIHNNGNGGPLSPIFLSTLYAKEPRPIAILNISGFANVTFVNENERLAAGLVAPGMALLNDFMLEKFDMPMDYDGAIAAKGKIHEDILKSMLDDEYFKKPIPKYVPRNYFNKFFGMVESIDKADGIATLTALVAFAIIDSIKGFPKVIVTGGGTKNPTLIRTLKTNAEFEVILSSSLDINPKITEAQAYAYLAVRNLQNFPSSFPETTGASSATICGSLYTP